MRPKIIKNQNKLKDKIISEFEYFSKFFPPLYKLLYETSQFNNVYFVGGFIRSIANNNTPRDLDVIFNISDDLLKEYFLKYNLSYSKNKLGGYKIICPIIKVDIWTTETNWAFKNKIIKLGSEDVIKKIAEGTFLNYDSLVFDLNSFKLNLKLYNECIIKYELDIIKKNSKYKFQNPGRFGNVLRILNIRKTTGLNFSISVCEYIHHQFKSIGIVDKKKKQKYLLEIIKSKNNERFLNLNDEHYLYDSLEYIENKLKLLTNENYSNQLDIW